MNVPTRTKHEKQSSARAVLKLLRPSLAEDEFACARLELRNTGRMLSAARDAKVIADRFDEMLRRADVERSSIGQLAIALHADAALSERRLSARSSNPTAALAGLSAARRRLARASLPATDWSPLGTGLRSIYRRDRSLMPGKANSGSTEAMHDWRKLVKGYWHVLEVFLPAQPAQIGQTIGHARRLAAVLGEDHDLALLADHLRTFAGGPGVSIGTLLHAIERRRRQLAGRAARIGSLLYGQPPAVMEKQMQRAWQRWRKARAESV